MQTSNLELEPFSCRNEKVKKRRADLTYVRFHITHINPYSSFHKKEISKLDGCFNLKDFQGYVNSKNPLVGAVTFAFQYAGAEASGRISYEERNAYIYNFLPDSHRLICREEDSYTQIQNIVHDVSQNKINKYLKSFPKRSKKPILVTHEDIYRRVRYDNSYWERAYEERKKFLQELEDFHFPKSEIKEEKNGQ